MEIRKGSENKVVVKDSSVTNILKYSLQKNAQHELVLS
jgi:hypothetical protein